MKQAPIPEDEDQRLVSLHKLGLLDTPPEERFDVITRSATRIFHVPISTLTLVDSKREWFKSCQGLPQHEGDRAVSFCGHALVSTDIMVVPDTKEDNRFSDNPMVVGKPFIRFYVGVPVMSADGKRIGVFCVKDTKPRKFSKKEGEVLKALASWTEAEINSRNLSLVLSQKQKTQTELNLQTQTLEKQSRSREKENKAMLNVMEDLEEARALMEVEKAKDEAMLESIGEGLIAVDKDRKITMFNKAAERMLGWKQDEILGRKITSLPLVDEVGNTLPLDKRPTFIALSKKKTGKQHLFFCQKK